MERFGEWRLVEPTRDNDDKPPPTSPVANASGADLRLMGLLTATILLATAGFIWLTGSGVPPTVSVAGQAAYFEPLTGTSVAAGQPAQTVAPAVIVDVEGAVLSPGLHRLAGGSRVGDAIAAAGGYSALVDAAAATRSLNLAQPLTDGAKIHVPVRGEMRPSPGQPGLGEQPANAGLPGGSGVIDINTATTDQLDTLPGIGPVTAAKIISARQAQRFVSVNELRSRDVVGASTFEKIRELITAGP